MIQKIKPTFVKKLMKKIQKALTITVVLVCSLTFMVVASDVSGYKVTALDSTNSINISKRKSAPLEMMTQAELVRDKFNLTETSASVESTVPQMKINRGNSVSVIADKKSIDFHATTLKFNSTTKGTDTLYVGQSKLLQAVEPVVFIGEKNIAKTIETTEEEINNNLANEYNEDDLFCLAVVIYQEAGGNACSNETRLMVGNVVLNRVSRKSFPNTIRGVVTQKGQYGRFYWTGVQFPSRASHPGEKEAVKRSYDCAKELLDGKRVLPMNVIFQAQTKQGSGVFKFIDGTYFCFA